MQLADFDFDLPADRIALHPARPRDHARMLVVDPAQAAFSDRQVLDLPSELQEGDVLVVNDTAVLMASLTAIRPARLVGGGSDEGVRLQVNLHKQTAPDIWAAFVKPAKRLRVGDQLIFGQDLSAHVDGLVEGEAILRFDRAGPDLEQAIMANGQPPLPPYIAARRPLSAQDRVDYETMFAGQERRSVAAPTAGLHFTPELIARLQAGGVSFEQVRLHVGAGTFLPVRTEDVRAHVMHAEWARVEAEVAARLNAARAAGRRVIAVGTTSLRTLESAVDADGQIQPMAAETSIYITPGYAFRAVDGLITNFHLPKSTLFMLVSAFSGQARMRAAYAHAIASNYRFYSYGDASLLWRA